MKPYYVNHGGLKSHFRNAARKEDLKFREITDMICRLIKRAADRKNNTLQEREAATTLAEKFSTMQRKAYLRMVNNLAWLSIHRQIDRKNPSFHKRPTAYHVP